MSFFDDYHELQKQETIKISYYVINYCQNKNIFITNLKLLKLLYFINIHHLICTHGKPIFKEEFLAWRHGPVLNSVYNYFKYGITTLTQNKIDQIKKDLGKEKITIIEETLDKYAQIDAWKLVEKTHINNGPWQTVFKNNKTNDNMCFDSIKHSEIYKFYKDIKDV